MLDTSNFLLKTNSVPNGLYYERSLYFQYINRGVHVISFARWFVKQNVCTETLYKVLEVWETLKYIKLDYYFHCYFNRRLQNTKISLKSHLLVKCLLTTT